MGPIRTAQVVAIVATPERFRTRRQLWSYSGLGIVTRSSEDWVQDRTGKWVRAQHAQTRGLSRKRHPRLKAVFKGAATTVIAQLKEATPADAGAEVGPWFEAKRSGEASGGTKALSGAWHPGCSGGSPILLDAQRRVRPDHTPQHQRTGITLTDSHARDRCSTTRALPSTTIRPLQEVARVLR